MSDSAFEKLVNVANEVDQSTATDPLGAAGQRIMNPLYNGLSESTEAASGIIANFFGNLFEIMNKDLSVVGDGILQENLGDLLSLEKIKDLETTSLVIALILSNALPGIVSNMGTTAIEPFLQNASQALLLSLKDASMIIPGVPLIYLAGDAVRAISIMGAAIIGISAAVAQGLIPAGQEYIQMATILKQAQQTIIANQKQQLLQNGQVGGQGAPEAAELAEPVTQIGGHKKSNKRQHKHSTKLIAKRVATSIHQFMETNNIHHNKTKKTVPKNKSSKKRKPVRR
jgi:type II secretory pathway pseudopilin PulG